MSPAELTFNKMNEIIAKASDPRDNIDFFITVGDNLYPVNATNPVDSEWDIMLSLFQKPNLTDLPVYAIRGNHDCLFDWKLELELAQKYKKWYMPSLYYKKEFEIGNGKKFGVVFTDSCLMLCSNFSYTGQGMTV
jgi:tartrate-resistant acid phosphatase type 5